jgi:hypothetical protein
MPGWSVSLHGWQGNSPEIFHLVKNARNGENLHKKSRGPDEIRGSTH